MSIKNVKMKFKDFNPKEYTVYGVGHFHYEFGRPPAIICHELVKLPFEVQNLETNEKYNCYYPIENKLTEILDFFWLDPETEIEVGYERH